MWYFSDALISTGASNQLDPADLRLLHAIRKAILYPFDGSMQGSSFELVTMLAEACRYRLAAEGKGSVSGNWLCLIARSTVHHIMTVPSKGQPPVFLRFDNCAFAVQ